MTIFEKSYFEMPVRESKSQCSLDLESGKISICEVPFEYRDAYRYSKAAEYIKSTKEAEKEIEKEVFRIQLFNDIAESRRVRKKVREEKIIPIHKTDSPSQFLSLFEKAAADFAAAFFRSAANSRILITNTKKKGAKK